ncbi:oxidative damage protection protein [Agarilytica rhodophyticola]|uniref:oxidative damage protection protein n=1 Tax=Agarilytica rhodophyticola TaxID=1737490 RepID=UPI000B340F1F|nr:oxidative damage protection protein [Agarilytica rhodophyticola]
MTRTVMCRKYKQELPALSAPPLPGARGAELFETISAKAWQDWLQHQTRLINEKHLNMMDPEARKYLSEQMEKFLSGAEYDQADGYIPEEKS